MKNKINIFNWSLIISPFFSILIFITFGCAEEPTEKAKEMIAQNKSNFAIEILDKEIIKNPLKVGAIIDLCFYEGAKKYKAKNANDANLLIKYAIDLTKNRNLSFPTSFVDYLATINDRDSILNLLSFVLQKYPSTYNEILSLINKLNVRLNAANICSGELIGFADGYSYVTWLSPTNKTPEFLRKKFGLSTFSPITAYYLTYLRQDQILSMNMEAINQCIERDQFFFRPSVYVDLRFSSVPELSGYFANLKNKTKYQIASEKEKIIDKIIETREKYLIANLRYIFTPFEVYGKCFAFEKEYSFDTQEAFIHMFLVNPIGSTVYIATAKIQLTLNEANNFFTNEVIEGKVIYKVSPGKERKDLGIAGGGVAAQIIPSMILLEKPKIIFEDKLNMTEFIVDGLEGGIWENVNTRRWDLNNMWQQNYGQKPHSENIRIVNGKKINTKNPDNKTDIDETKSFVSPQKLEAVIDDIDGYTNIRSGPGTQYEIVSKVADNEIFYIVSQQGNWWKVKTKEGKYGYIHNSRIRLKN